MSSYSGATINDKPYPNTQWQYQLTIISWQQHQSDNLNDTPNVTTPLVTTQKTGALTMLPFDGLSSSVKSDDLIQLYFLMLVSDYTSFGKRERRRHHFMTIICSDNPSYTIIFGSVIYYHWKVIQKSFITAIGNTLLCISVLSSNHLFRVITLTWIQRFRLWLRLLKS
jgi:hypothetical protein